MKKLVFTLIIVFCSLAPAEERLEFYQGIRQLGMGGAGIALVNDETSLLTNPAGLGKLRDYILTVVDPEVGGSEKDVGIILNGQPAELINAQGLLSNLRNPKNMGKHFHLRGQVFPSAVFPNFGIGLLAKYEYNAEVDDTDTDYKLQYTNDIAAVVGYNFRFWDGRLKIGFNGRLINRVTVNETFPTTSTNLEFKNIASQGIGLASDVGVILSAPIRYLPSLAAVVRDVGNTQYNVADGILSGEAGEPPQTAQSIDVAFAFFPIFANKVRSSISVEYRGIDSPDEVDALNRIHAGIELNFSDVIYVRGGMNQIYWTGGLEFQSSKFQFQAATYGEEIGTNLHKREDRRYVGKFSFRF